MKSIRTVITLTSLALLSACGGGNKAVDGAAALSSTNMDLTAQDTAAAAFQPVKETQAQITGAQVADESLLFGAARTELDQLQTYLTNATANSSLVGAMTTVPMNCTNGGTKSVATNDVDGNGVVSPGDSLTITFNNCAESLFTRNGSLTFVVNTLTGGAYKSTTYNAGVTMTYADFAVSIPNLFSATANGSVNLALDVRAQYDFTYTVTTQSLGVVATYLNQITRTRTLTNYTATTVRTPPVASSTIYQTSHTFTGNLTSTGLGSRSVSFVTPMPFVVQGTDTYPSTGELMINGANGAKLRVSALDNVSVKKELDLSGDGTWDASVTSNWSTLF